MTTYEIFWNDLSEEAKERLKELHHENIELSPLAIVEIEESEEWVCAKCGSDEVANDDFETPADVRCSACYRGE